MQVARFVEELAALALLRRRRSHFTEADVLELCQQEHERNAQQAAAWREAWQERSSRGTPAGRDRLRRAARGTSIMRAQRRKAQCCSLGASLVIAACRSEPFGVRAARRGPRVQLLKERCALFRPVVPSGADAAPEGARPLRCYELLHVGLLHSLVAQRRARTSARRRPPVGGDRVPCGARCLATELRAWHGLDEGPMAGGQRRAKRGQRFACAHAGRSVSSSSSSGRSSRS